MPWVTYTALVRHIMRTASNGGHRPLSHGELNAHVRRFPTRQGRRCGCPREGEEEEECGCAVFGLYDDESTMQADEYYIAAATFV